MIGVDGHDALVRRETAISIAINMVLSAAAFLLLFGYGGVVPVAGLHGLAVDILPQALIVAIMGSLVPGLLTRRRLRGRAVAPREGTARLPLAARALLVGLGVMVVAGGGAWLACRSSDVASMTAAAALSIKVLFGGAVALIVTPSAVRSALLAPAAWSDPGHRPASRLGSEAP